MDFPLWLFTIFFFVQFFLLLIFYSKIAVKFWRSCFRSFFPLLATFHLAHKVFLEANFYCFFLFSVIPCTFCQYVDVVPLFFCSERKMSISLTAPFFYGAEQCSGRIHLVFIRSCTWIRMRNRTFFFVASFFFVIIIFVEFLIDKILCERFSVAKCWM